MARCNFTTFQESIRELVVQLIDWVWYDSATEHDPRPTILARNKIRAVTGMRCAPGFVGAAWTAPAAMDGYGDRLRNREPGRAAATRPGAACADAAGWSLAASLSFRLREPGHRKLHGRHQRPLPFVRRDGNSQSLSAQRPWRK